MRSTIPGAEELKPGIWLKERNGIQAAAMAGGRDNVEEKQCHPEP